MAETWHVASTGITFASAKSMIDLFNTDATKINRVYRCWCLNNQGSAVTGVLTAMRINRLTTGAPSGGSTLTPVAHDTNNASLAAGTTAGTGRTPTRGSMFRQFYWSNDEPAVSGATMDEMEVLVPLGLVWDSGYGDSNVDPITCRQNFGFEVQQSGSSAVGTMDIDYEFTNV